MKADHLLEDDWADEPEVIDFSKLIVTILDYETLEDRVDDLLILASKEYPIHAEWPRVAYLNDQWLTDEDDGWWEDNEEFYLFVVRGKRQSKELLDGHEVELAKWLNDNGIVPS